MPSWRNWISRLTSNQKIVGSSPTGGNKNYFHSNRMCYLHMLLNLPNIFYNMLSHIYKGNPENEENRENLYYVLK